MRIFPLFILVLILASCRSKHEGYTRIDKGIYYSLHQFHEGPTLAEREFADLDIYLGNLYDSGDLLYAPLFVRNLKEDAIGNNRIASKIYKLTEGDSASFIIPYSVLKNVSFIPEVSLQASDSSSILLHIKVHELLSGDEYRETLIDASKEDLKEEMIFIERQLRENGIYQDVQWKNGVFIQKKEKGQGDTILAGTEVALSYKGFFLNGEAFDPNRGDSLLYFQLGQPDQVLKGIELAIHSAQFGDSLHVYVPSAYAFGSKGSSTGIVPPFTPVIFHLRILNPLDSALVVENLP